MTMASAPLLPFILNGDKAISQPKELGESKSLKKSTVPKQFDPFYVLGLSIEEISSMEEEISLRHALNEDQRK